MGGRWLSRRAILLHLTIVVVVPTFILAFLWQVHRALGGNELSWAYVFEWPFFTGYAVYLWWRLVHEAPGRPEPVSAAVAAMLQAADGDPGAPPAGHTLAAGEIPLATGEEDEELAAYNRYLAQLDAGRRKHR